MKNNTLLIIIVGVIMLSGMYLSSNKSSKVSNTAITEKSTVSHVLEESATENATYGHVHSLFINPSDNTLLMGTHHGVFKSTDGGKTFTKVDLKGNINSDDFMNFAYDSNNKVLYAGGHDVGVVKSVDGGVVDKS